MTSILGLGAGAAAGSGAGAATVGRKIHDSHDSRIPSLPRLAGAGDASGETGRGFAICGLHPDPATASETIAMARVKFLAMLDQATQAERSRQRAPRRDARP